MILFHGAHPRWDADGILFAHTSVELLPGYDAFAGELSRGREVHRDVVNMFDDLDHARMDVHAGVIEQQAATCQVEGRTNGEGNSIEDLPSGTTVKPNEAANGTTRGSVDATYDHDNMLSNQPQTPTQPTPKKDSISPPTQSQSPSTVRHIPVFSENHNRSSVRKFRFIGYYIVANVDFLAPHSSELVRMLEQKWDACHKSNTFGRWLEGRVRDPDAWAKSLSYVWAVVKMAKIMDEKC